MSSNTKKMLILSFTPFICYGIWIMIVISDIIGNTISHQQIVMFCIANLFAYIWDICFQKVSEDIEADYKVISDWSHNLNIADPIVYGVAFVFIATDLIFIVCALTLHTIYPKWQYIKYAYIIFVTINILLDIYMQIKYRDKSK